MKNFLLSYLLLILVSNFVFASNIDVENNNYYTLIKDKLNEQVEQTEERERLLSIFDDFVTRNQEKINILGCNFNLIEVNKENINNTLNKFNFFADYKQELNKYHLSLNQFDRLYFIDEFNLPEDCIPFNYKYIIQLENNELMIPYQNQLIFYQKLSEEDEKKINNLEANKSCLPIKQSNMEITYNCKYKNMTILDVYHAMSFYPSKIFREKIKEGKNFSTFYEDKYVKVEYKWSGKNKLKITQNFDGGVTTYTFIYQGNKTKLITVYSPD